MHITEHLLQTSYNDYQILENLESQGHKAYLLHTLDYCLATEDKEQAETVTSFIKDNAYGIAEIDLGEDNIYRILIKVETPLIRSVIFNISANMLFISNLFNVEYIGWGTTIEID